MAEIKTPWGSILTKVNLFPIYYLFFMYGFLYIFPFGENIVGKSWFYFINGEDGIIESLQFFQYLISSLIGIFIFYKSKKKKSLNLLIWLGFSILCFFLAGEEISWGERITGISINAITNLSIQGETNLHNLPFFHNFLLDPILQAMCLFFGWIGWKRFPYLTSLPSKKFSLFFLFAAMFFAYYDLSWASTIEHIRDDSELFELLFSTGIFLHFWDNLKNRKFN